MEIGQRQDRRATHKLEISVLLVASMFRVGEEGMGICQSRHSDQVIQMLWNFCKGRWH